MTKKWTILYHAKLSKYIIASKTFSTYNKIKTLSIYTFIYILYTACPDRLCDSILWTTEYKGIRTYHAELTDRSMYFHLTGTEMTVTKQNP